MRSAFTAGLLDAPPAGTLIENGLPVEGLGEASGIRVAIRTPDGLLGALCAHDRERRFDREDELFLEAAAGILAATEARSRAESRLRYQALHDPLTGLPNRALLQDRLEHALARAARGGGDVGALFIDLDHFKVINDSLGHDVGDELLAQVAARLSSELRDSDTLGRLGGDEFIVIAESGGEPAQLVRLAQRLGAALRHPFECAATSSRSRRASGSPAARATTTAARWSVTPTPRCTARSTSAVPATSSSTPRCATACCAA